MAPILVLYATSEGQSRRIAAHAAARLRRKQLSVQTLDAAELPREFTLGHYGGALLIAPVHATRHPREMVKFISAHRAELESLPARLLSVSLSQAGVEMAQATPAQRLKAEQDVRYLIELLCKRTRFPPHNVVPIAGALAYSKYSFLKRMVMRRISKQAGGSTDTSRDHVYTDYAKLDEVVDGFAAQLMLPAQQAVA